MRAARSSMETIEPNAYDWRTRRRMSAASASCCGGRSTIGSLAIIPPARTRAQRVDRFGGAVDRGQDGCGEDRPAPRLEHDAQHVRLAEVPVVAVVDRDERMPLGQQVAVAEAELEPEGGEPERERHDDNAGDHAAAVADQPRDEAVHGAERP